MMAKRRDKPLKIDMPFEDALRRILKAGPMPKTKRAKATRQKNRHTRGQ
jgi:hypothetical protein